MTKRSSVTRKRRPNKEGVLNLAIKEFNEAERKRLRTQTGTEMKPDYVTTNYQIASGNRSDTVTQEEFEEQKKVLSTLAETSKHLAVETDIITLLEGIAESVTKSLGVKKVNFWDYTPDRKGCHIIAAYGLQDQYIANSINHPMPLGEAWIGRAMATGQAWGTSDAQKDPLMPKVWMPTMKKQDYHGLLCMPLKRGDQVIGGMCLYHQDKHEWKFFEYEVMTIVANQAATALTNARAFAELKREQNKITSIINSLEDGLILIDTHDTILLINPRANELLEIGDINVLGQKLTKEFTQEDRNLRNLRDIVKTNLEDRETREIEIRTSRPIALKVTKVPVRNEQGRGFGHVYLLHDTSKEREIELMKSNFVSVASHQIRTPLTGISWTIDTLSKEEAGTLNEQQKTLLDKVSTTTSHFAELINDLLDVSQIDEGRMDFTFEVTPLLPVVEKTFHDLIPFANARSIDFILNVDGDIPKVRLDERKFGMAAQNIMDNALKYSNKSSGVTVTIRAVSSAVRLEVTDKGIGIPNEQKPFIFNKFFRAANAVRSVPNSSGLGLYITKQIIEEHGGKVYFESTEGEGSTFIIELPLP